MQELILSTDELYKDYQKIKDLNYNEPVLVLQIFNDITDDWDYSKGKVCMFGLIKNGTIQLFTKDKHEDSKFTDTITQIMSSESYVYSFNAVMVSKLLRKNFGVTTFVKEIRKVKGKGQTRVELYNKVVKDNGLGEFNLSLNMDFDNVPKYYQEYLQDKNSIGMFNLQKQTIESLIADTLILKNM